MQAREVERGTQRRSFLGIGEENLELVLTGRRILVLSVSM
jgi:hypothetical protein